MPTTGWTRGLREGSGGGVVERAELLGALELARDMPDGEEKIAELERIVAYADAARSVRLGFDARIELIAAYNSGVERWRMLPVFGWCLAAFDRHRALFRDRAAELRWYHKRAVAVARGTSRIGLAQAQASVDDLERRLETGGHRLQVVHRLRCQLADHLGDETTARDWLARWRAEARDENSDCAGCEPAQQAELLAGWGDWAEAVRVVEPVLDGVPGCLDQPERALAAVLVPYLRLGRFDEAARAHVTAYRRHREERGSLPFLAGHLRFCALTGHHERGLDILGEHLGRLDRPYDELSAMEFATAGALVCRSAADAGLDGWVVHRPAYGDRPAADLPVPALAADLLAVAEDLAGRFDARNGTTHQSGRIAAWLADRPLCAPFPLPPDGLPADELPADELPADELPADELPADETAQGDPGVTTGADPGEAAPTDNAA